MRATFSARLQQLTAFFRLLPFVAALSAALCMVSSCGVKPPSSAPPVNAEASAAPQRPADQPPAASLGQDNPKVDSPASVIAGAFPLKKKASSGMPRFVDDSYGTGALGPRILYHESEVIDVTPQRMDVYLRVDSGLEGSLLTDAEARAAAAAAAASGERTQSLTADSDGLAGQDSPKTTGASVPRKGVAGARPARPVRVWEAREPRPARYASPLSPAQVDTRAYLASLGILSVYDLSPASRRLALPQGQRLGASPLLGRGALQRGIAPVTLTPKQWEEMIQESGRLFGLDPQFIAAIIKVESNFDHLAVSSKGAQGAMQIMPGTQAQLGLKDPFDVQANIHAGCAFIRELLLQYGSTELALAAYNAGPGAVDKYGGIPPYAETKNYVRRVMALWRGEETQAAEPGVSTGASEKIAVPNSSSAKSTVTRRSHSGKSGKSSRGHRRKKRRK